MISRSIIQILKAPDLVLLKAIFTPFGDQLGASLCAFGVTTRGIEGPPFEGMTYSPRYLPSIAAYTNNEPLGERARYR